ncbi:DUF402 domain-containing protein [Deinococcus fonticola]|uniref:DUF402 domain-containing protein n=1 Tax=Deinococcus fonticola TaxID=2528713 RepID=UPI0010753805|nr:DUF402 domain-containing protein [Deinococcus fonticola]
MRWRRHELQRWERWKDGSFQVLQVPDGVIVDFRISEVHAPFVSTVRGEGRTIFDVGFRWVYFTPLAQQHSVILVLDAANVPLQVYVDITQGNRLDPDGVPAIDDVFLDVLAWVELTSDGKWRLGEPEIVDQHELDEALAAGLLSPNQHAAAWAEARRVVDMLSTGRFPALEIIRSYLTHS